MGDFAGRVAIVTGASWGVGRAVALALAQQGAAPVLVGHDAAALAQTADAAGGGAQVVLGDEARADTAVRAVAAARDRHGRLDIVANVAGALPTALLGDTDDAAYYAAIAANLTGTFMLCRAAAPLLRETGVEAFGRAIAIELASRVRVNTVSAGPTSTGAVRELMASDRTGAVAAVTDGLPPQRMAAPAEIAETILFLASSRTRFVTGQVWQVNGGGVMP